MDRTEISRPVFITPNGPNYIHWAEAMTNFLQARNVWHLITREVTKLIQKRDGSDKAFTDRQHD